MRDSEETYKPKARNIFSQLYAPYQCYSINFGVGPATFTVKACINVAEKKLSVCVSVSVGPLSKELGCVDGSLSEGVTIKFNWYVVKGSLMFYVKDKALWVHWDITVLGKQYTGDVKLIRIPTSLPEILCVRIPETSLKQKGTIHKEGSDQYPLASPEEPPNRKRLFTDNIGRNGWPNISSADPQKKITPSIWSTTKQQAIP
ncbi:hypothetical protein BKA70DRAFT_1223937 [Coprinopsis sp. MPI-PUGE-AT-0042]|nr:hypothetical protein BKA70DRAFT_1223937 [Coprinopsis sp. MPI-PUGE-AT-0042]